MKIALFKVNPRSYVKETPEECGCGVGFLHKMLKNQFKVVSNIPDVVIVQYVYVGIMIL